ncbi:esterase family protein [Arthrobacter sp. PAMC25284]|uniref:Esterase n=1 Tax=Arthrobacter oryzae TaxID=409290 RepID=A0A3N0C6I7_9MICC|nr:esterase family protein [Arthrobacter sp. PAMC25284]RNL58624.1 esterase [Arthrobacter oryzae]
MDFLQDIRLVDGPVMWFAWAAGASGLAFLAWRAVRHRKPTASAALLGTTAVLAAALVAGIHWLLIYGWSVFPDELPPDILGWSLPAAAALFLWLHRLGGLWLRSGRSAGPQPARRRTTARPWRATAGATAALLGVVLLSQAQINLYFGLNQTVGDVTGTAVERIPWLEAELTRGASPAVDLAQWDDPGGMPAGVLRKATIPGTASGFTSRDAYIYLPPAYQSVPRPKLPVLVLFAGQPGSPQDWLVGGALRARMDRFADGHRGIAPVTVVVDPNGTQSANTLCLDSRIAQADTFLSVDVPGWIKTNLDVDPDPRLWTAGGFSFGATCAVQMVTRHPGVYHDAVAVASEKEPALAKERDKTVQASFGGDTAAFDRQTPLWLMQHRSYTGQAIVFYAGGRDREFMDNMSVLADAATASGFIVKSNVIANAGHSWQTASAGLADALEFLAPRWGIT